MGVITNERYKELAISMMTWIDKHAFDNEEAFATMGVTADELLCLRSDADLIVARREAAAQRRIDAVLAE